MGSGLADRTRGALSRLVAIGGFDCRSGLGSCICPATAPGCTQPAVRIVAADEAGRRIDSGGPCRRVCPFNERAGAEGFQLLAAPWHGSLLGLPASIFSSITQFSESASRGARCRRCLADPSLTSGLHRWFPNARRGSFSRSVELSHRASIYRCRADELVSGWQCAQRVHPGGRRGRADRAVDARGGCPDRTTTGSQSATRVLGSSDPCHAPLGNPATHRGPHLVERQPTLRRSTRNLVGCAGPGHPRGSLVLLGGDSQSGLGESRPISLARSVEDGSLSSTGERGQLRTQSPLVAW